MYEYFLLIEDHFRKKINAWNFCIIVFYIYIYNFIIRDKAKCKIFMLSCRKNNPKQNCIWNTKKKTIQTWNLISFKKIFYLKKKFWTDDTGWCCENNPVFRKKIWTTLRLYLIKENNSAWLEFEVWDDKICNLTRWGGFRGTILGEFLNFRTFRTFESLELF